MSRLFACSDSLSNVDIIENFHTGTSKKNYIMKKVNFFYTLCQFGTLPNLCDDTSSYRTQH